MGFSPFCGWFSGQRLWPRCLWAEQTPPSPSFAPTPTHQFLHEAKRHIHIYTSYLRPCGEPCNLPWTLMSAMLRWSSHTTTWIQLSTAKSLKLNTLESLAPLNAADKHDVSEAEGDASPFTWRSALTCQGLAGFLHLFFGILVTCSDELWWHGAVEIVDGWQKSVGVKEELQGGKLHLKHQQINSCLNDNYYMWFHLWTCSKFSSGFLSVFMLVKGIKNVQTAN